MYWDSYKKAFRAEAARQGKSVSYCNSRLSYAKKLYEQKLPIIYSVSHFCRLVGYREDFVRWISKEQSRSYRTFYVKKKSGGERRIDEPLPSLKEIQTWILNEILNKVKPSPYAKAYRKGMSLKSSARFHLNQDKVLTLDLKDFFPSIKEKKVLEIFRRLGYRRPVAELFARLCTYEGSLPQGAPTSPALSNLAAGRLDEAIAALVLPLGVRYTRYADDLTFSGDFAAGELIAKIRDIVHAHGFRLNAKKTRVRRSYQRQEVTGIVVNEKMNLPRSYRRRIRSHIYYIKKYGLASHLARIGETRDNYLYHLMGQISYSLHINGEDSEMQGYRDFARRLLDEQA